MSKERIFFTNLDELKEGLESKAPKEFSVDTFNTPQEKEEWFVEDHEGQLAIDVYQTADEIVVKSTIAGVEPEELDIFLNDDLLTIRGKRIQTTEEKGANYFYKECYWGGFSRSVILPVDVNPQEIKADLKNGILTVRLPKIERTKTVSIKVKKQD